jgi:hypothetical protein
VNAITVAIGALATVLAFDGRVPTWAVLAGAALAGVLLLQ